MTNRDYFRGLSNKELAELIVGEEICDSIETCLDRNCTRCITKWLDTERKPNVEAKC